MGLVVVAFEAVGCCISMGDVGVHIFCCISISNAEAVQLLRRFICRLLIIFQDNVCAKLEICHRPIGTVMFAKMTKQNT